MEDLIPISKLKGITFFIPSHQRGYRWREENVIAMLSDFKEFIAQGKSDDSKGRVYCLQPLAITPNGNDSYCVEDGQQRLTTLYLLIKYLFEDDNHFYSFEFESDQNNRRKNFMENGVIDENYKQFSDINFFHIAWAYQTIKKWFESGDGKGLENDFKVLLNALEKENSLQFIWYEISKENARKVFRDLNYGKIRLTGSDLIKALLLSKDNGLSNEQRIVISTQLDEMSQRLSDNRFWFVFQHHAPLYHSDRLDFLFNLTEKVSDDEYKHYPYKAFEAFAKAKKNNCLYEEWQKARKMYHNLEDFYENPFIYHYIGFLVFLSGNTSKSTFPLYDWIKKYQSTTKIRFVIELRKSIKAKIGLTGIEIEKVEYSDREKVRSILLLHNIETVLLQYRTMRKRLGLQREFEQFPFDLLHRQNWDIEHLASQTDNPLKSEKEWNEWIDSTKTDYPSLFKSSLNKDSSEETNRILILYNKYISKKVGNRNRDDFKDLYKLIVESIDKELGEEKVKFKDGIGNLVLLDRHTNRSYHNSLYPTKRKTIIESNAYIPICTKRVFTKFYNTTPSVRMNAWTQTDYDFYLKDIMNTLYFYLSPQYKQ